MMQKFKTLTGKATLLTKQLRFYKNPSQNNQNSFPFQDDLKGDPKYQSMNTMYSDMFTPDDSLERTSMPIGANDLNQQAAFDDDIAAINQEIQNFFEPSMSVQAKPNFTMLNATQLETLAKNDGKFVVKSLSNNPFFNLALEDYIFESTPRPENFSTDDYKNQRLIFYINSKCCVIGKNQNPWKELYLENLKAQGIPFLRRRSGGGCVVHDLGNVNYSFLTSRKEFDKTFFNELIVNSLKANDKGSSTKELKLNERGDITLNGYKVSGSAFKVAKNKSYHHGTMLISSALPQFKNLLKPDTVAGEQWDCNSVESVRSHICNLKDYNVMTQTEDFVQLISKSFNDYFAEENGEVEPLKMFQCDESVSEIPEIKATMEKLQTAEWKYDHTPRFKVSYSGDRWYQVEKGVIVDSYEKAEIGQRFAAA
ncbi:hypothetical protein ACO0QE_004037 [Hanseniaspora vineae]